MIFTINFVIFVNHSVYISNKHVYSVKIYDYLLSLTPRRKKNVRE